MRMTVGRARAVAREWVVAEARGFPGFFGAYFAGSTNQLSEDAAFPATSDVDVTLAIDGPVPPIKLGKFLHRGVLLDVTYRSWKALRSPVNAERRTG